MAAIKEKTPAGEWWRLQLPIPVALILCMLIPASSSAQWSSLLFSKPKPSLAEHNLRTPKTTLEQFCNAVRQQDWEMEYRCSSNSLRSRFTYMLIRSIDELSGEQDLMENATFILTQHAIPDEAFTSYPSLRSTNNQITPEEFQKELQNRLKNWRTEIFPKVKDWPKIIQQIQPLLNENYDRHSHDLTHPSQSGIVRHLRFHYYATPFDLSISQQKAEASIVAIVRDPDWQPLESEPDPAETKTKTFGERFTQKIAKLMEGPNIRRPTAKVQLILEESEWRVEVIPYR